MSAREISESLHPSPPLELEGTEDGKTTAPLNDDAMILVRIKMALLTLLNGFRLAARLRLRWRRR